MPKDFEKEALLYHQTPQPGKIALSSTKPLQTPHDMALAYSPGVAVACHAIIKEPGQVAHLTARANLVGVITNGTAVLGLGNIGPLAAKPVMEGKAVLFKKFAGIDAFDIELNEQNPEKIISIVTALEPTFGGINLEDFKAPECFQIEQELQKLSIPVFHDDQHGTAIIVAAAVLNGLKIVEKDIAHIKIAVAGAGAAALACLDQIVRLGAQRSNIYISDVEGVVYKGRTILMDPYKAQYAQDTPYRSLADIMKSADVFIGLSVAGIVSAEMIASMAENPLVFALANPTPEIMPAIVKKVRPDAIIATGRTDFPNQVNNVLCFPYIFRGALDVGATIINAAMKDACVHALANLALAETWDSVSAVYGATHMRFGPDYLIPKPFDPRLILELAPAVAKAAMESGVATRPIQDFDHYKQTLSEFVFRSGLVMRPIFLQARQKLKRVVYSEGTDERVLAAVQTAVDEKLLFPILLGNAENIQAKIKKLGLRLRPQQDYQTADIEDNPFYENYWQSYYELMQRKGVSVAMAQSLIRTHTTLNGALMLMKGHADALLCGMTGAYHSHLDHLKEIIGLAKGVEPAALNVVITDKGTFFICDTYVNTDPTSTDITAMTLMAAQTVRQFGITPKVALVSHSSFGSSKCYQAEKLRQALQSIRQLDPCLEIEGEMSADAAFSETIRSQLFPNSALDGMANLLIMPNLDAANIALTLLRGLGYALSIGPLLLGIKKPAHILTSSTSVRGILNMSALAAVEAQGLFSKNN